MNIQTFIAMHPIFRGIDLEQQPGIRGAQTANDRKKLLAYHRMRGRIIPVRPGLYASVPAGIRAESYSVDPHLVASRLTDDAIIGYHSALMLHGVAHSVRNELTVVTAQARYVPFRFQGITYRTVLPPKALVRSGMQGDGVVDVERLGMSIRVTSLERTLVDLLDRPRLAGGLEEIWRSYEAVPYLDLDQVVNYVLPLNNTTIVAKVGFFLEQQRTRWMVSEEHLAHLRAHRPRQPHYLDRKRHETGHLVQSWNLIVPASITNHNWEETDESLA